MFMLRHRERLSPVTTIATREPGGRQVHFMLDYYTNRSVNPKLNHY